LGVPVVPGGLSAEAFTAMARLWPRVVEVAASWPGTVLADLGRLQPGDPAAPVAAMSTASLLLARPDLEGLYHLRERVSELAATVGRPTLDRTPLAVVVRGKPIQVVVLRHQRVLLLTRELPARRRERVVERLAGQLLEVFVAFHRGQPEAVLQLLLTPHLRDAQRLVGHVLLQPRPDPDRVDQRAVHVEGERLGSSHVFSPSSTSNRPGLGAEAPQGHIRTQLLLVVPRDRARLAVGCG